MPAHSPPTAGVVPTVFPAVSVQAMVHSGALQSKSTATLPSQLSGQVVPWAVVAMASPSVSETGTGSTTMHPAPSVTVTVYRPAQTPAMKSPMAMVSPVASVHTARMSGVPPLMAICAPPLHSWHSLSVTVRSTASGSGSSST